jgi:hypothetical protein
VYGRPVNHTVQVELHHTIYALEIKLSGPTGMHRGTHRQGSLNTLDQSALHELFLSNYAGCLCWLQKKKVKLSTTTRSSETKEDGTYPQEPVKIDSSRVERTMEVINRVLDCIVLGD